jgi:hypothetical protein
MLENKNRSTKKIHNQWQWGFFCKKKRGAVTGVVTPDATAQAIDAIGWLRLLLLLLLFSP